MTTEYIYMTVTELDNYFNIVAISRSDQDQFAGIAFLLGGIGMVLFHRIIVRKAMDNPDIEPLGEKFVRLITLIVGSGFILGGISLLLGRFGNA